jgi:hypothetical protein
MDKKVNRVTIEGLTEINWIDTKIDLPDGDDSFRREIGKSEFVIFGGEKVLRKKIVPTKAFKKVQPHSTLTTDFITMDIETTLDNNDKAIPYLIAAYDGSRYIYSYFGSALAPPWLRPGSALAPPELKGGGKPPN